MRNFYQFLPAFRNEKSYMKQPKQFGQKKRILNLKKIQRKFSLISANLSDKIFHSRDRTISWDRNLQTNEKTKYDESKNTMSNGKKSTQN